MDLRNFYTDGTEVGGITGGENAVCAPCRNAMPGEFMIIAHFTTIHMLLGQDSLSDRMVGL